jgi:hypothetical protein
MINSCLTVRLLPVVFTLCVLSNCQRASISKCIGQHTSSRSPSTCGCVSRSSIKNMPGAGAGLPPLSSPPPCCRHASLATVRWGACPSTAPRTTPPHSPARRFNKRGQWCHGYGSRAEGTDCACAHRRCAACCLPGSRCKSHLAIAHKIHWATRPGCVVHALHSPRLHFAAAEQVHQPPRYFLVC